LFNKVLGFIFPPKLPTIEDKDAFVRRIRIQEGELKVYHAEQDPAEGVGPTLEWTPGRWGTCKEKQGSTNRPYDQGRIEVEGMGQASLG